MSGKCVPNSLAYFPLRVSGSAGLTPLAITRTSASSSLGFGCGTSSNFNTSGAPYSCATTAFIAQASLLLVFAFSDCSKQQGSGGLARLKPCRLPGIDEKLLCGQLTVFENRLTRTGRAIELNVVVLPAFDQKTKAEPLFDLAGGPGAAATESATFYTQEGKEV